MNVFLKRAREAAAAREQPIKEEHTTPPPSPPPPPASAKRVRFADADMAAIDDDDAAASAATTAAAARRTKKSSGVSKRPQDVFVQDAALTSKLMHKPVEPTASVLATTPDGNGAVEPAPAFSVDAYGVAQRHLVEAVLRSSDFTEPGAERDAQNVKAALVQAQQRQPGVSPAAYTNHMIRIVDSERARTSVDGVQLLDATPYTDSTVSAFAANFIANAIECAPDLNAHEHVPSKEMRAASRPLKYAYIESFMRTAHPNEFACASREQCVGMELYDEHGHRLTGTVWKVFWFPDEFDAVATDPDKFAAEAKFRYCIGCKIEKANKCFINVKSRNNRVSADTLAADFHVFVDIQGEYPIEATRGRCPDGHYGLVQNIPVWSRVGWTETPDGQRANCYIYRSNTPTYPIPRAWYERNLAAPGF